MRTSQTLSKMIAALSLAVAVVLGTSANAVQPAAGEVVAVNVKGTVKYSTPGGPWLPLTDKMTLPVGATVQTTTGSVVLIFNSRDGVNVKENTTLVVEKVEKIGSDDSDVSLNLQVGTLAGKVKKISKASHFEIKTPDGVAGIRGTSFSITVTALPDGKFQVAYSCLDGIVVVVTKDPATGAITTTTLSDKMSVTVAPGLPPVQVQLTADQIDQLTNSVMVIADALIDFLRTTGFPTISVGNPVIIASPTTGR
jgi:hypothetical protein